MGLFRKTFNDWNQKGVEAYARQDYATASQCFAKALNLGGNTSPVILRNYANSMIALNDAGSVLNYLQAQAAAMPDGGRAQEIIDEICWEAWIPEFAAQFRTQASGLGAIFGALLGGTAGAAAGHALEYTLLNAGNNSDIPQEASVQSFRSGYDETDDESPAISFWVSFQVSGHYARRCRLKVSLYDAKNVPIPPLAEAVGRYGTRGGPVGVEIPFQPGHPIAAYTDVGLRLPLGAISSSALGQGCRAQLQVIGPAAAGGRVLATEFCEVAVPKLSPQVTIAYSVHGQVGIVDITSAPDDQFVGVFFEDANGERLRATTRLHRDDEGYFLAQQPLVRGSARVAVPLGAVTVPVTGQYTLHVLSGVTDSSQNVVISAMANRSVQLQRGRSGGLIEMINPLIELLLWVAHADGELRREEVRWVKQTVESMLGSEHPETEALKTALRAGRPKDIHKSLTKAKDLGVYSTWDDECLQMFVALATADGPLLDAEILAITQIAVAMGADEAAVKQELEQLAAPSREALRQAFDLFGLPYDAKLDQVRRAWRTAVAEYHPDRCAGLPPAFQRLATAKCQELNAAFSLIETSFGVPDQ